MCASHHHFYYSSHQILTFFFFNFLFYFIFLRVTSSTYNFERHPRTKCTNTRRIMFFYVSFLCFTFRLLAVIHYSPNSVMNFSCLGYTFFSVSLSSQRALPLYWPMCSFKGSRDAGLNQRRTRYIYTLIFRSFFMIFYEEKKLCRSCDEEILMRPPKLELVVTNWWRLKWNSNQKLTIFLPFFCIFSLFLIA